MWLTFLLTVSSATTRYGLAGEVEGPGERAQSRLILDGNLVVRVAACAAPEQGDLCAARAWPTSLTGAPRPRSGWIGSCISTQHNANGRGRRPPGRLSPSLAPRSAANCMCSPPMTLRRRNAAGWRLLGPSASAWGCGGCTPRHPAGLLTAEEAWAGLVKMPVTGAGSLFAAAAALTGSSRAVARTPRPGRLMSAGQGRTAECDLAPLVRLAKGQAFRPLAPASAAPAA